MRQAATPGEPHSATLPHVPVEGLWLTGRGDTAGQAMTLRLLFEHELAAGLDAEVLLCLGDVAG